MEKIHSMRLYESDIEPALKALEALHDRGFNYEAKTVAGLVMEKLEKASVAASKTIGEKVLLSDSEIIAVLNGIKLLDHEGQIAIHGNDRANDKYRFLRSTLQRELAGPK